VSGIDSQGYAFVSTGVTIPDINVTFNGAALVSGKDYKVAYSGNKKVGTAKYTVSFLGNYKGSKAVSGTFEIHAASLSNGKVAAGDKIYTGKSGTYVSKPIVTLNGVALKASDYTVRYYQDADRTQEITGKSKLTLPDGAPSATVYVEVSGKGNYAGNDSVAVGTYQVCRKSESMTDLSKARVTFWEEKQTGGRTELVKLTKAEYTGSAQTPIVLVEYKDGNEWKTVPEEQYEVTYTNNVEKGKATVVVNGTGTGFVGSKTAAFSITARNVKGLADTLKGLIR
jgi:hypothetical protein